jgi:hypothetical protein
MSGAVPVSALEDQIQELKRYCDELHVGEEANVKLYLLKNLRLPSKCEPSSCDALLCPTTHNGYPSRLYFATQIRGPFGRNWNFNGRILERNWHAFSFTVATEGRSLVDILKSHLTGLVQST